jgi:SAM-dependent methyltransferase
VVPLRGAPQMTIGRSLRVIDPLMVFIKLPRGKTVILAKTDAQIYAEHRPRYPQNLIDDLRGRTIGDHGGMLVEWGCGTGELTLPLSPYFDEVRAIDTNAERISIAEDGARKRDIDNIEWQVGRAESLEIGPKSCDLIASASAFHWMDRELLSERAFDGLKLGGALAITGGAGPGNQILPRSRNRNSPGMSIGSAPAA